jgi:adenosylhomocysteine nucleosidase
MQTTPIAIIAALDDEIKKIKSEMEVDSRQHKKPAVFTKGVYRRKPILLVRSGIGRNAMGRAIARCLDEYNPELCLHIGYCGGADPKFEAGDLIIGERVVDSADGASFDADPELILKAEAACRGAELRCGVAGLVTVDDVISGPHEKAFLGTQHEAGGVDMESAVLARACAERGTPCLVVRAVLDPMDFMFPKLGDVVDENGVADPLALVGHLIKKPSDIVKLPKVQYLATQARIAMKHFIDAWLDDNA